MAQSLKISLIQSNIFWENIEANLLHYNELISLIDSNPEVIVLPEMFTTGFTMNTESLAEGFDGKTLNWMRLTASRHNFVVTGSIIFKEDNKIFNRLIWMNPDGSFSIYDKRHLFRMGGEKTQYSRGDSKIIITYKDWKICPLICYDLRFPVWSRNVEGYDVLIYIASWPSVRDDVWKTLLKARAIENQCFVVGVNRVGKDGQGISYTGGSMMLEPTGKRLNRLVLNEEVIITETLNFKKLDNFRILS